MSGGLLSISSSVFCTAKYRGGVRKDGGVNKNGGASWFVLLAAEKNEQIKRINVTRTFFDWERKSFVSQSSLAVPRSITGCHKTAWRKRLLFNPLPLCFVTQNIGGVPKGRRG